MVDVGLGQMRNHSLFFLQRPRKLQVLAPDGQGDLLLGSHLLLGSRVADLGDDAAHPVKAILSILVGKGAAGQVQPRGDHQRGGAGAATRQPLPHGLRDVGHEGVQQLQGHLEHVQEHPLGDGARWARGVAPQLLLQARLRGLQVPRGEVVLEELLQLFRGRSEAVLQQRLGDALNHPVAPREQRPLDPRHGAELLLREARARGQLGAQRGLILLVLDDDEAADVPDFVGEALRVVHNALAQRRVHARLAARQEGVPKGICAQLLDRHQRIHDVPRGLAHLLPLLVPNQAMKVYLLEGRLPRKRYAHHNHPCNPKE
mmetsp:Transcript_61357/g.159294  ORF Transcript_61357/g.159294 Transcript_61357/m.159294 type:complete len:316 (-) Transcript_61357:773-1720(-)